MNQFLKIAYALMLWLPAANSFSQSTTKAAPNVGDVPPALQLSQIIQGSSLNEISWDKLKGKVVVLEFWDTACVPCIKAIPHLNELVEKFSNKSVVFLSVSDDNPDRIKQFLLRRPIKTWIALDKSFSPTKTAFGVDGIPATFIIDQSGRIVAITHPATLEAKHLNEILAGKPPGLPLPERESTSEILTVATGSNLPPTEVSVSISGPIPMPTQGAFDSRGWNESHTVFEARKAYIGDALAAFFGVSRKLIVEENKLTQNLYDITAVAPPGQSQQLQARFTEVLKTNLAISVQLTDREMNVYTMTVCLTNAAGLRPEAKSGGGGGIAGGFKLGGSSMNDIASFFENYFDRPIMNETKLSGFWGADIKWKMSEEELCYLDNDVWRVLRSYPNAIKTGNLPPELRDKITDHDLKLLQTELAKPAEQQFQPNPTNVIKAAREQLGLEIKSTKRKLQVVEVHSVN